VVEIKVYRLLIVDDEQHVVDWLYDLFSDVKHIEFDIYKAYSATSALKWLSRTKIDIVLTDIDMPKMNGLQLFDKIRKEWPECKVVFLTGYNDFEYAHKAIQNDAVGYVLKTEGDEEIIKTVEKAVMQIEESLKIDKVKKEAKLQIKNILPLIQREFIIELLYGEQIYNGLLQKQLDDINISLKIDYPVLILLGGRDETSEKFTYVQNNEFFISLNLICDRFLSAFVTSFYSVLDNYTAVWLMQPLEWGERKSEENVLWEKVSLFVRDTLETIQAACKKTLKTSISFVLGCQKTTWDRLPTKYSELKKLLAYRMGLGTDMLLTDRGFFYIGNKKVLQHDNLVKEAYLKLNKIETMKFYLERGKKEDFYFMLNEITDGIRTVKSLNCNPVREIYYSLALMFLSYMNKKNLAEKITFKIGLNKLMKVDEHTSWNDALDYLYSLTDIIFDVQRSEQDTATSNTISRVMHYVDNNLYEDLSLVRLAELVYFNPSYLSRLFKQVTGVNLTDYIYGKKTDKAKLLLEDPSLKIHEVASKVGYNSSTYFARFFKKMTGLNPQEYRDFILKGKEKTMM
jgi:two-component system, response regulator YesN